MSAAPRTPRRSTVATEADELAAGWQKLVGFGAHKVLLFEHLGRKRVLYLRWRPVGKGNWQYRSLATVADRDGPATLFDERGRRLTGRALEARKAWAIAEAEQQYERNKAGAPGDDAAGAPRPAAAPATPLTLAEGLARVIDPATGKYPSDSSYRRLVVVDMERAIAVLGADTPWEAIKREQLTKLWRRRLADVGAKGTGAGGLPAAKATVKRVLAVAQWLRDMELIPPGACVAPTHWLQLVDEDYGKLRGGELPEVRRPRHTVDQMRRILAASPAVDPRLHLLLAVGAELRPGQVRRGKRSDLTLAGPDAGAHGTFRVRARGKKGGTVVELTAGQRAAVEAAMSADAGGYLAEFEAAFRAGTLADYPLFPSGRLVQRRRKRPWRAGTEAVAPHATVGRHAHRAPLHDGRFRELFRLAEAAAEVPPVEGRVFYGIRRIAVDAATDLDISPDGLKALGGWSDMATPLGIYKAKDSVRGRQVARDVRAQIRGEAAPDGAPASPAQPAAPPAPEPE